MTRCRVEMEELEHDSQQVQSLFDIDADIDQRKEALINTETGMPPFDIWLLMSEEDKEAYGNGSKKWRDQ